MNTRFCEFCWRRKSPFFQFLARLQVQPFILLYLKRKKTAFLLLLVIHQKHAAQKNLKSVFRTRFRLLQMMIERLWHGG